MEEYILISYATKNQLYIDYADKLIQLFADYNINNYHIEYFNFVYSKMDGCLIKPGFILNQLKKRKKSVICIDIDSVIINYPYSIEELFLKNYNFDIGFAFTTERKNIITNGIHIWNYTDRTIDFLNCWNNLCCDPKIQTLDHHRLIDTYHELKQRTDIIDIRSIISNWFVAKFSQDGSNLYY